MSIYFVSDDPHGKSKISSVLSMISVSAVRTVYLIATSSEFPTLSIDTAKLVKTSISKQGTTCYASISTSSIKNTYYVYKCILFPLTEFSSIELKVSAGGEYKTVKLTTGRNIDDVKFRLFDGDTFVDFGTIKSVSTSYGASVSQNGMMYTGFENAYCYDSGVGRTYTISFERANPINPSSSESGDTAKWSNRDWLEYIKGIFKKPQLSTDGFRAFFNSKDKLYPSFDSNVYIANFTIDGNTDTSQAVASTLTMSVGSVRGSADYTEVITPVMHTLTFNPNMSWQSSHTVNISDNTQYILPYPDNEWVLKKAETGAVFKQWYCNTDSAYYDVGKTITVIKNMSFEPVWAVPSKRTVIRSDTYGYEGDFSMGNDTTSATIVCVGGGGAGGGGAKLYYVVGERITYKHQGTTAGGGGGDCGKVTSRTVRDDFPKTWRYSLGAGGEGVISKITIRNTPAVALDGGMGGSTYFTSSNGAYRIVAGGGAGGKGGSVSFKESSGEEVYDNAEGGLSGDTSITDGSGGCVRWKHGKRLDKTSELYEKVNAKNGATGTTKRGGRGGAILTFQNTNIENSAGGGGGGNGCSDSLYTLLEYAGATFTKGGDGFKAVSVSGTGFDVEDATAGTMSCGGGGGGYDPANSSRKSGNGGDGFIIVLEYTS